MVDIHTDVQVQSPQGKWAALPAPQAEPVDPHKALPAPHPSPTRSQPVPRFTWAPHCQTLLRNPWNYLWSLGLVPERSSQLTHLLQGTLLPQLCLGGSKKTKPQPKPGLRNARKKAGKEQGLLGLRHQRTSKSKAPLRSNRIPHTAGKQFPPKHLWSAAFPSDVRLQKCPSWTAHSSSHWFHCHISSI